MLLPTTLSTAAAAALLAMWLGMRVGRVRQEAKIVHGDGGHDLLTRRMRAQLNFVEYTPFVLVLIAAIELAGKGGIWLKAVAAIYILGRIAHLFGMDSETVPRPRVAGIAITFLTLAGLAIYAALIAAGVA